MPDEEGYDFTFNRDRQFYLDGIAKDEDDDIIALDGDAHLTFRFEYAADPDTYYVELTSEDATEIQILNPTAGTYRVYLPFGLTKDLPVGAYKYEVRYMADDDPITNPLNLNPNEGLEETGYFKLQDILAETS
jgi:hypothetical protein